MNPHDSDRLRAIVAGHAPQHEQNATTEVNVQTLLGVGVSFACQPNGQQILVITKMRNGQPADQIHVPMDAVYAAKLRREWDASLATARGHAIVNGDSDPED
jgi:hypothetical protein